MGRPDSIVVMPPTCQPDTTYLRIGCFDGLKREVVQRIVINGVVADSEIVDHVRRERMRVGGQQVLVDTWNNSARRRDGRGTRVEFVLPVVARIQPDLVAAVPIDPGQALPRAS